MHELERAIVSNIWDLEQNIWFPKLTPLLVKNEWARLAVQRNINQSNYSTQTFIKGNNKSKVPAVFILSNQLPVFEVPESLEGKIGNGRSYTSQEIMDSNALICLENAFNVLSQDESLAVTINQLIVNLHLIKADDGYDISFSEPDIPFSAFISVPITSTKNDALRVAEEILHEAMHLQLTLIDQITPLIKKGYDQSYFSPWKNEFRHPNGLIHALYVFGVILKFLSRIDKSSEIQEYRSARITEIKTQMTSVSAFRAFEGLTKTGRALIERIFEL